MALELSRTNSPELDDRSLSLKLNEVEPFGLEILIVDQDVETVARITDLAKRNGHKVKVLKDPIKLLSELPLKLYDALILVRISRA